MATSERGLVFEDQSADALWLTLVDGDLDTNQFSIVTEAELQLPRGGVLQAGIIGASHFLSVVRDGRRFTEVFACTQARAENTLARFPLPNLVHAPVVLDGGRYQFEARKIPWTPEGMDERDRLLEEIAFTGGGTSIGLSFVFPDAPKAPAADRGTALTALVAKVRGDLVSVRTLHAYPGSSMVFTTSTIGRKT